MRYKYATILVQILCQRKKQSDVLSANHLHRCTVLLRCLAHWSVIARLAIAERQVLARKAESAFLRHQLLILRRVWQIWQDWLVQCKIQHWAMVRAEEHFRHKMLLPVIRLWKAGVNSIRLHRDSVCIALHHWCTYRLRVCFAKWHTWVARVVWER